ncbi:DUF6011 domain-containing protein [Pseudomonas aeruginosa]|uniref:DUF6011 domain-containing protein n=1 Tax=Pseudomonas aeruginosa TaxID=287 RepID=UPI00093D1255|nr:DUF6011 domain-containing protein [Pseudomonas aeruginosa]MBG4610145.1 hypothetical protein [Pseudomonas aeruginosa]MBG5537668.1 hypothetical protein [Pseudomonas aeruginosa]MBG5781857.1 hypothetical protein [Pseudomonas aeruginosa]MBT9112136.1 hypothetical protein [Pseudomonas aeruginosa]MBT9117877.1 hypothetical protein [Pseudomonas aeruginosa]
MQAAREFNGFDDLGEDFASVPVIADLPKTIEQASSLKSERKVSTAKAFIETCPRCHGSGRYHRCSEHGTICLKCNGKGKLEFASSPEQRAAARARVAKKKEDNSLAKLRAFEAQHPDIAAWWTDSDYGFAVSLRADAARFGRLSENQMDAARRCIEKLDAAKAERAVREQAVVDSPVLDLTSIATAMGKALAAGIKRPKMRLLAGEQGFVLSFAPDTGKWAGSLYAKNTDGEYLGRITAGKFHPTRDVGPDFAAAIRAACEKPLESAVAYGRKTGSCSCCGRELTDSASIEAGIGPICESKFF